MSVQEYCVAEPGAYKNDPCVRNPARVIAVHYLNESAYPLDWENDTAWGAAQDAGTLKSIYETRGDYDGGEYEEADGFGKAVSTLTNKIHTMTYRHRGVNAKDGSDNFQNQDFYTALLKNENKYHVIFITGDDKARYSTVPVTVKPKDPVSESITEEQLYDTEVVWQELAMLSKFDAPATAISATG